MAFITNITHFFDHNGEISELPDEAKQLLEFLSAIISDVSNEIEEPIVCTDIKCRESSGMALCTGEIEAWHNDDDYIEWHCSDCNDNGLISHWRKTRWDNSFKKLH